MNFRTFILYLWIGNYNINYNIFTEIKLFVMKNIFNNQNQKYGQNIDIDRKELLNQVLYRYVTGFNIQQQAYLQKIRYYNNSTILVATITVILYYLVRKRYINL